MGAAGQDQVVRFDGRACRHRLRGLSEDEQSQIDGQGEPVDGSQLDSHVMNHQARETGMKILLSMAFLCLSFSTLAETVTDLARSTGGAYAMKIDGRPYVAIAKAQSDEMIKSLQQVAELKQGLAKAEEELTKYRSLTHSYEKLSKDYPALIEKYKALTEDNLKLGEKNSEAAGKLVTLNGDYPQLVRS